MNLNLITKRVERLIVTNAPVILTGVGVAGTLATAYLTGRASFKAAEILREEKDERIANVQPEITKKEIALLVGPQYLPAIGVSAVTIASIIFANRISTKRAMAMAAAYAVSEKTLSEYKDKVKEHFGEGKEQKIRQEIAQDRVTAQAPREILITGSGEVLCHDLYSGRYFRSSMESLKKAQNDLNYQLLNDGYASLTEFYSLIGLTKTKFSDGVGWNSDRQLELVFASTLSEEDQPCLTVDFFTAPSVDYYKSY